MQVFPGQTQVVPGPPCQEGDWRDVYPGPGPSDHPQIMLVINKKQTLSALDNSVSDTLTSLLCFILGSTPSII